MSNRTYIKNTKSYERGWRIALLVVFFLGLLLVSWGWWKLVGSHAAAPGVVILGGLTLLVSGFWFSLNELTAHGHGLLGEPRGSRSVRRLIKEAEEEVSGMTIQERLSLMQRFVDYYSLDLPPDLEESIRRLKQRIER